MRIAMVLVVLASGQSTLGTRASAYHTGGTFDAAPGAGGGGGLFYTGSPRERGWDCTACHIDPPRRLRVTIASDPADLFATTSYEPGQPYTITVAMADPSSELGRAAGASNYNSMAVTVVGDELAPAGNISGFDAARFHAHNANILASDSTEGGETSWTFTWTAPAAGFGTVGMYVAVVDGNGGTETGDLLGDDTATGAFRLSERGATAAQEASLRDDVGERLAVREPEADVSDRLAIGPLLIVALLALGYRPRRAQRPRR